MTARANLTSVADRLAVLRNRDVRRLELALLFSETSAPAYATALLVYAYGHGHASAVGVVGLASLLPSALIAPLAGALPDRFRPQRVMAASAVFRAIVLAAVAGAMASGASLAVLVPLAALGSVPTRVFRPAQMALLPALTRSEHELTAANAIGGAIENVGTVAGPALGGGLLLLAGPPAAAAVCALAALAGGVIVATIRGGSKTEQHDCGQARFELLAGVRAIRSVQALRLVVSLFSLQTVIFGAFTVLVVDLALSELAAGPGSVGLLNGMLGAGGVVGALVGLAAFARLPLGRQLCLGTLVWGAPLVLVALVPTLTVALPLFLCVGIGNVTVDVSAYTLIQRSAPEGGLGRIFGALEGLSVASGGLGVGLGGMLADLLGTRPVLAASGLALIGLALGSRQALERLDQPAPSRSATCHGGDGPRVSWAGDADPAAS